MQEEISQVRIPKNQITDGDDAQFALHMQQYLVNVWRQFRTGKAVSAPPHGSDPLLSTTVCLGSNLLSIDPPSGASILGELALSFSPWK